MITLDLILLGPQTSLIGSTNTLLERESKQQSFPSSPRTTDVNSSNISTILSILCTEIKIRVPFIPHSQVNSIKHRGGELQGQFGSIYMDTVALLTLNMHYTAKRRLT